MGIQGLIPFLEKSSRPINVTQFSGSTAAIDAYCWLHKGVFSCADKLAINDTCDAYVHYCMRLVNTLLARNIKPILVFDGQKLPAKAGTEKKRKELRERNRKKAAELMRCDQRKEAQTYLRQSIDVTHKMALNLIHACRACNVDCLVAPYEADAQLAYLNIHQIAEIIITEDSDLLLFGAKKVLFKMDVNGNGLLVEQENLHISMGVKKEKFSLEKFRYMCILSGCDYLASLPGIGLAKARQFITRTVDPNIYRALHRIGSHLNMPQIKVSDEYRHNFMNADFMFKHQPVFDLFSKKLVPLTPISPKDKENYDKFSDLLASNNLSDQQICHLAFGNLDPFTLCPLDDWTPESAASKEKKNNKKWNLKAPHSSIWHTNYTPRVIKKSTIIPSIAFNSWRKTSSRNVSCEYNDLDRDPDCTSSATLPKIKTTDIDHQQPWQLKLIYANTTCKNDDRGKQPSEISCDEENKNGKTVSIDADVELPNLPQTNLTNNSALSTELTYSHRPELKNNGPWIVSRYFSGNMAENKTAAIKESENSKIPVSEKISHHQENTETDQCSCSSSHSYPYRTPSNDRSNSSPEITSKRSNPFCVKKRRLEFSLAIDDTNDDDVRGNTVNVQTNHRTRTTVSSAFKWTDFSPNNISSINVPEAAPTHLKKINLTSMLNNYGSDSQQPPSNRSNSKNSLVVFPTRPSASYTPLSSNFVEQPKNKFNLHSAATVTSSDCTMSKLARTSSPKQLSLLSMFAYKKPEKIIV